MARYSAGSLISKLRERVGMEREALLMLCGIDDSSLRRIESDEQLPKEVTLELIMKAMRIPLEGFVYPLIDYQDMAVYSLRDRLSQALEMGDLAVAQETITHMESLPAFNAGIQLQFKLSKKAQLWEMMGMPASLILPMVRDALKITFTINREKEIKGTRERVFILEEPELLHTMARIHAKNGRLDTAVRILSQMKASMDRLPAADKEKEQQFAPVLLSLSTYLLEIKDYKGACEISEVGAAFSAARKQGRLNPDFEYIRALALHGQKQTEKCRSPLQYAYFGFALLGETSRAKEVLACASEDFGVTINTYGVDELDFTQHPKVPYSRGEVVECYSLGTMISALRKKAGLTLEQLSSGICHKSTLLNIEMDKSQGQIYTLEAVMQRLGRDIYQYTTFFLSKEEFVATQLRDRIEVLIAERCFTEAAIVLGRLETLKRPLRHKVNLQFVMMIKTILFAASGNEAHADYPTMLLDALKITLPSFDERNIAEYHLTFNEIAIIAQYAAYYNRIDDPVHAASIYGRLYRNIASKYADEVVKARMYSTILSNYSTCLGRAGRLNETLAILTEGESFERSRGRLNVLPNFAFNKGYTLLMLGKGKESIPHIALSYYGASLLAKYGKAEYLPLIKEYARESMGLEFD